jgi:hypothetical protein
LGCMDKTHCNLISRVKHKGWHNMCYHTI